MIDDLRVHPGAESGPRAVGELVLYWMQTTHRAHDNFAFELAVRQADRLRLPVVVCHALRPDYPWASDRLHTFILPGEGRRPERSPLVELAERAALVVTDYFPTFIAPRQTRALRRKVETPVVAVDSCTVAPMRHLDRQHSTARSIRSSSRPRPFRRWWRRSRWTTPCPPRARSGAAPAPAAPAAGKFDVGAYVSRYEGAH